MIIYSKIYFTFANEIIEPKKTMYIQGKRAIDKSRSHVIISILPPPHVNAWFSHRCGNTLVKAKEALLYNTICINIFCWYIFFLWTCIKN